MIRTLSIRLLFVVVVSGLVVGCQSPEGDDPQRSSGGDAGVESDAGADGAESDDAVGDADLEDTGGDTGTDNGDSEVVELEGTWVRLISTSVLTETLLGDDEEESKNVSVERVEIDQQDHQLSLDVEVCSLEILEDSDLAETTIPESFVDSLQPATRQATVDGDQFQRPTDFEVRGVEFADGEDPQTESLPTDPDDPRVVDQDGDGNPGLTIEIDAGITAGEVYVVQRVVDSLEGTVEDDGDTISGLVDWQEDQEILGASDDLLTTVEPQTRPNPDEEASRFEMVRLGDDEPTDCQTLADERDVRFDVQAP